MSLKREKTYAAVIRGGLASILKVAEIHVLVGGRSRRAARAQAVIDWADKEGGPARVVRLRQVRHEASRRAWKRAQAQREDQDYNDATPYWENPDSGWM